MTLFMSLEDAVDICDLDCRRETAQDDGIFQLEALFNTNMSTSLDLSASGPIVFLFNHVFCSLDIL